MLDCVEIFLPLSMQTVTVFLLNVTLLLRGSYFFLFTLHNYRRPPLTMCRSHIDQPHSANAQPLFTPWPQKEEAQNFHRHLLLVFTDTQLAPRSASSEDNLYLVLDRRTSGDQRSMLFVLEYSSRSVHHIHAAGGV